MDRRNFLQALAAFGLGAVTRPGAAAPRLVVVVHPRNPVKTLEIGELEAIFTTRKLDWPHGDRIVAFNFPAQHAVRVAFDRAALHMEPAEVARFWIDRRIRGGHPPPKSVPDAKTMIRVVGSYQAAVGYVLREDLDGSVRAVAEV